MLMQGVLQEVRSTLGNRHIITLETINNLSTLLIEKGDLVAAEPLLREAMEGYRATLGDRSSAALGTMTNLGRLLRDKGDLAL